MEQLKKDYLKKYFKLKFDKRRKGLTVDFLHIGEILSSNQKFSKVDSVDSLILKNIVDYCLLSKESGSEAKEYCLNLMVFKNEEDFFSKILTFLTKNHSANFKKALDKFKKENDKFSKNEVNFPNLENQPSTSEYKHNPKM